MKTSSLSLGWLATVLLAGWCSAQEVVVYDTFGSGGTYDPANASVMAGVDSTLGFFSSGFLFTPTTTIRLNSIQVPLGWITGNGSFTWSVQRADRSQDLPGTLLESFTRQPAPNAVLTLSSTGQPILAAGESYWLVGSGNQDSAGAWQVNNIGHRGLFYSTQGGREVAAVDQQTAAFRITGIVVPEPSSVILIALGGACYAMLIRKMRP